MNRQVTTDLLKHKKYSNPVIKQMQNKMQYYFLLTKLEGFEKYYFSTLK